MLVVWTERARKLAKLQLDFVAGVSHEFRTPLAVICSAAENLADGVIDAEQQMKQYGTLIREQGRRLAEMVEQILLFAGQQKGSRRYEFRPVSMNEVIDAVLAESAPMIEAAGFTVEKHVEGNLAPVMADTGALTVCMRNLISNALKYGVANRWMGICAATGAGGEESEIQVTVEDRGPGIEADDLRHIFEPFYRGNAGATVQTYGTGLGLSLAKDIAEAMGGRLSVRSAPGQGSSFTLHLPVLRSLGGSSAEAA
jgi:signal transduction histidine kinase